MRQRGAGGMKKFEVRKLEFSINLNVQIWYASDGLKIDHLEM